MKELLNYNFNCKQIDDGNFELLFEKRRRDATFAYVYEKDGKVYAIRDHLGIVPLYYRYKDNEFRFSTNFTDLIRAGDEIDKVGLSSLLGMCTPRLFPLIKDISIVPPGSVLELDKQSGEVSVVYQYRLKTSMMSDSKTMNDFVNRADELFFKAIKRLVKYDTVGLCLSGGMDSALIGIYLKKLGVKVNAYTSVPEGINSVEARHAAANANFIGVENHYVDCLETKKYKELFFLIPEVYGVPHGTPTSLAVVSLWKNTPIGSEQQVFFGQNSDTMTCSVGHQYRLFFLYYYPAFIRRRIKIQHYNKTIRLPFDEMLKNYIFLRSKGFVSEYSHLHDLCDMSNITNLQLMTIAGMFFGHTPCDSEELSQPALHENIIISNPYNDMDLVEFCLSIPLRFRISLSVSWKLRFTLFIKKRVFRKLALKYLPRHIVNRKKAFIVPMERNEKSKEFISLLPTKISDMELTNIQSKTAAGVLREWCALHGLKLDCDNTYISEMP